MSQLAEKLNEEGAEMQVVVFNRAYRQIIDCDIPSIKTWKDLETAFNIARKASGMDKDDKTQGGLNLAILNHMGDLPDAGSDAEIVTIDSDEG